MKPKLLKIAYVGALVLGYPPVVHPYGCGVDKERFACDPPTFTNLAPERETEVAAFSEFSFLMSKEVKVPTLVVKVNGQPVQVSAEQKTLGLQVKGKLAQPITQTGVVVVSAAIEDASGGCPGHLAYRVKVSGEASEQASVKSD